MSTRRKPGAVKDAVSYLGGWALIVHQVAFVPSQDFNLWALTTGALLVGVPGFSQLAPHLVQLLASKLGTGSGPSGSPPEVSPPPSPPSSSSSGADR
jgi:hypothetical protein